MSSSPAAGCPWETETLSSRYSNAGAPFTLGESRFPGHPLAFAFQNPSRLCPDLPVDPLGILLADEARKAAYFRYSQRW